MAATGKEISNWFERGITDGAAYLIVVCDTFDHDDYPVFTYGDAEVLEKYRHYDGKNMQ